MKQILKTTIDQLDGLQNCLKEISAIDDEDYMTLQERTRNWFDEFASQNLKNRRQTSKALTDLRYYTGDLKNSKNLFEKLGRITENYKNRGNELEVPFEASLISLRNISNVMKAMASFGSRRDNNMQMRQPSRSRSLNKLGTPQSQPKYYRYDENGKKVEYRPNFGNKGQSPYRKRGNLEAVLFPDFNADPKVLRPNGSDRSPMRNTPTRQLRGSNNQRPLTPNSQIRRNSSKSGLSITLKEPERRKTVVDYLTGEKLVKVTSPKGMTIKKIETVNGRELKITKDLLKRLSTRTSDSANGLSPLESKNRKLELGTSSMQISKLTGSNYERKEPIVGNGRERRPSYLEKNGVKMNQQKKLNSKNDLYSKFSVEVFECSNSKLLSKV
jgi:hypothetical protein